MIYYYQSDLFHKNTKGHRNSVGYSKYLLKLLLWYKRVTNTTSIWKHSGFFLFFFSDEGLLLNKIKTIWNGCLRIMTVFLEGKTWCHLRSRLKCWAITEKENEHLRAYSLVFFFFFFRLNCFFLSTVSSHNSQHIFQSNWKLEDSSKHSKILKFIKMLYFSFILPLISLIYSLFCPLVDSING